MQYSNKTSSSSHLPFQVLLVLFEYCITYRDKSVDAERIGSYMNLTKSRLRQALGDESFCALVFLSFNSPALSQVDLDRILERWEKDDHTLGAKKANRGDVITRLERDGKKHTIFDDGDLLAARDEKEGEEGAQQQQAGGRGPRGGWWWAGTRGLDGHWEWREE